MATALVALAVVGGLGASLWQRAEAHRERDRAQVAAVEAQAQADRAEAVAGFLEQILRAPNQRWYNDGVATGPETPIRAVLDEAATRVDRDFADQPDLLADLHHVLGDTYGALGLVDEAAPSPCASRSTSRPIPRSRRRCTTRPRATGTT